MSEINRIQANLLNFGTSVSDMTAYLGALNIKEWLIVGVGAKLGTNLGHSASSNACKFNLNCDQISGVDLGEDFGSYPGSDSGFDLGIDLGIDLVSDITSNPGSDLGTDIGFDLGCLEGTISWNKFSPSPSLVQ